MMRIIFCPYLSQTKECPCEYEEKCNEGSGSKKSCWYDHCQEVCVHAGTEKCPLKLKGSGSSKK